MCETMRLFYAPNTISVATALALEETGQFYEAVLVDMTKGAQQSPEFLAVNPKGRVPALDMNGAVYTETGALLELVAPELMPTDPLQAARARAVMYFLASTMHVNHAHSRRGHRWADKAESLADMSAKVSQTMSASADYVEAECLRGPFVLGADIIVADLYLFTVCRWLPGDGVDMSRYPMINAFLAAMEERASVQALRAKGIIT